MLLLTLATVVSCAGRRASDAPPPTLGLRGVRFEFVRIPPGEFLMGSESREDARPVHRVRISHSFDIGKTEVTVAQFRAFTEAAGYVTDAEKRSVRFNWRRPGFSQTDAHPAVVLSWNDAAAFCQWLSRETGALYRMPSEAEWEYAARAGQSTDAPADVDRVAWHSKNSGNGTHPVATKAANAFGLHDMLGNAWEWSEDPWHTNYVGAPSDSRPWPGGDARPAPRFGWKAGDGHSLRGGGWYLGPDVASFISRQAWPRESACTASGFRLLRALGTPPN
jgi:formylglycine-generating enzyme required for sulfatase activity